MSDDTKPDQAQTPQTPQTPATATESKPGRANKPTAQPPQTPATEPPTVAPEADPEKEARREALQAELDKLQGRGALTSKDARRIHEIREHLAKLGE